MKNFVYFFLAFASMLFLACIGYTGLSAAGFLPELAIINTIAGIFAGTGHLTDVSLFSFIPLVIIALFAFINFFGKNLKILFFIITILLIALDVIVLFFPTIIAVPTV